VYDQPEPMTLHTSSLVAEEYARTSSSYDMRWSRYLQATIHATVRKLPRLPKEAVVIDLACGTGAFAEALCEQQQNISNFVGLDISCEMLAVAKSKTFGCQTEWHRAAADAELPIAPNQADLVVTTSALHYFNQPDKALSEAVRVLKPSGVFLCGDWCGDYLTCRLLEAWLWLRGKASHKIWTLREAEDMLKRSGLKLESSGSQLLLGFWGYMVLVARKE
jgi:ubiquinone/menaquinone biosynthesis C-methylase UbiE